MKRLAKIVKFAFGATFALSILFVVLYFFGARQLGSLEARYDLMRGHYEIRGYGLGPFMAYEDDWPVFKSRGIKFVAVAGCVVNAFIIENVAAYNSVMRTAILDKFGIDIDRWKYWDEEEKRDSPFYEELAKKQVDAFNRDSGGPLKIIHTRKPEEGAGTIYKIGPCIQTMQANIDDDEELESVCLRKLTFKESDMPFVHTSLVVDAFKDDGWILRQELDRTFFYDEQFVAFKDLDEDGQSEMITRVNFGPHWPSERALRVYRLRDGSFDLILSVFGLSLDNPGIRGTLLILPHLDKIATGLPISPYLDGSPCDYSGACANSDPWLIDSDRDGHPEIILLVAPTIETINERGNRYTVFTGRFGPRGNLINQKFYPTALQCCDAFVDFLGFLATKDGHTHMLVNFAHAGTDSGYPVLNIFDIQPAEIEKIAEFSGFYEHTISWRIRDDNNNGNPEIIIVNDAYWPPGKSHSEIEIDYGIAEYRNGKYLKLQDAKFELAFEN